MNRVRQAIVAFFLMFFAFYVIGVFGYILSRFIYKVEICWMCALSSGDVIIVVTIVALAYALWVLFSKDKGDKHD